jgi:hypothetical protein
MKKLVWLLSMTLVAAPLVGCGSSGKETLAAATPNTSTEEVSSPEASTEQKEEAEQHHPRSFVKAVALAGRHRRHGEIVIEAEGEGNHGPHRFLPGIYSVRFQQFTAGQEDINFSTESSSLVVQLDRKPGEITAETVTVFNVTKGSGSNQITVPGGTFYVNVSADHGVVLRFRHE